MSENKDKMTIIFFSGSVDKAIAMLTLATAGAAMGMEVSVFFTFWGLAFLKKGKKYGKKNILQKMMEFMMPKNRTKLPLSQMNMMGLGPVMLEAMIKKSKAFGVNELLELAKEQKVKFYACSTSCSIMGVEEDNFINEVDDTVGATAFLKEAKEANINLFI